MKQIFSRIPLLAGLLATSITTANAQDERDALRYSMLQPMGTARSIGIGGALGSVGGDYSSLSVNPAGIGIYHSSEFTVSPSLTFSGTSSAYTGNSADESGTHFAFSNLGLVTTSVNNGRRLKRSGGWTTFSFGIGLTRLADFTRDYSYQGRSTSSSGSFIFAQDANDPLGGFTQNVDPVSQADLGYDAYLLDTANGQWTSVVKPSASAPVSQSTIIRERGGISELGFTLGGSYHDKLLLGATLGVPIVRYSRDKIYEEHDLSGDANNNFDYFRYNEDLKTNGAGLNLKLGMIYKVSDNFRFGAAIHTPTYYSLTDVQNRSLDANTENFGGSRSVYAVENQYDYNMTTPWRGVLSATGLFGPLGFFTLDYEYVDYSSARLRFGESATEKDQERFVNDQIKANYQGASNVRAGLEFRLGNISLRGGAGYYGNPYKSGNPDAYRLTFSGGIGFRFERAFLDLGFVHSQWENAEQPYQLSDIAPYSNAIIPAAPTATLNTGSNNAVMTVGFKF